MRSYIPKSAVLVLLLGISLATLEDKPKLKFREDGTFTFVQFTDIHFGEDDKADLLNQKLIGNVLDWEKPDFAVITGDVVSGYAWDGVTRPWYALQYANFTKVMIEKKMPWALTAGNHDSEGDLTRAEVSELDRTYQLSYTQPNAQPTLSHSFNYVLPVYDSKGENVAFRTWYLDSG